MSTVTTPPTANPFSIVVGLKFSDGGNYAFDQAAQIARGIPAAAMHLVHVFEKAPTADEAASMRQHLALFANEKVASLGGSPSRVTGIHFRTGSVAKGIVQLASEIGASLVVLGSEKPSAKDWFSSPTAEKVLARASCPVLVAGPRPTAEPAEPMIEPACPDCVATRRSTRGATWWCARHAEHARGAHTFSYQRELPFSTHDSQLGPTGV